MRHFVEFCGAIDNLLSSSKRIFIKKPKPKHRAIVQGQALAYNKKPLQGTEHGQKTEIQL